MIAIIDYGAGNLSSVKNALDFLKIESTITDNPEEIMKADKVILPGVGSFGDMIENLQEKKLVDPIKKFIASGRPFLGICLGLQALFEESEESPGVSGLGVFKGKVVKFTKGKVPQIGWNKIEPKQEGIFEEGYVYFVNSYYVFPEDKEIIATTTDYNGDFTSAVKKDNVTAVQFHPEKSGDFGIKIIKRWLKS